MQTLITDHAHVNFAAGDVLFGNRVCLGLAMNELDALSQLLVVIHDRGARDADRTFLADRLDQQRKFQPL